MNSEEAIKTLEKNINPYCLNDIQEIIFCRSFEGYTYSEIAETLGYNTDYIKEVGANLWKVLSRKLQIKVSKKNLRVVIRKKSKVYCYPQKSN